jgi:hypothetical protein
VLKLRAAIPCSTVALRLRVRIEGAKYVLIYFFRKLSLQIHSMAFQSCKQLFQRGVKKQGHGGNWAHTFLMKQSLL